MLGAGQIRFLKLTPMLNQSLVKHTYKILSL